MTSSPHKLIILGSGPAALTAAIYAARADLQPLIIEGKNPGGQLMGTSIIENWPGIPSILGPPFMKQMRDHVQKYKVTFVEDAVERVDFSQHPFSMQTTHGDTFKANSLIIATGAVPNKLNCTGESD